MTLIDDTGAPLSFGFGTWAGAQPGECSAEVHNRYSGVRAADGFRYHMFHPTRDPETGCTFGHDHGMDPALSSLEDLFGPIYFAVANQTGMLGGVQMVHTCTDQITNAIVRCEDNVGQKTLNGRREFTSKVEGAAVLSCDTRVLFHMGTSTIDAATNNLHGFTYQLGNCDSEQDIYFDVTFLAQIDKPGGFTRACDGVYLTMGAYMPFNSPIVVNHLNKGGSFGTRNIPEAKCIEGKAGHSASTSFHELWRAVVVLNSPVPTIKISSYTRPRIQITDQNSAALQVNWYWNASPVVRYLDSVTKKLKYSVDACQEKDSAGAFMAKTGPCVNFRKLEAKVGHTIAFNDPDSTFCGCSLSMRETGFQFKNGPSPKTKPDVWFTDKDGLNPSLEEFPGSLRWEGRPTEWYVNAIG
ncbi:MAG: hypothetical protein V4628_18375, partial [Pseudomonadota bacterium]